MCNKKFWSFLGIIFGERINKDQKSTALVTERAKKRKEENDTQNTDWFSRIGGLLKREKTRNEKGKRGGRAS